MDDLATDVGTLVENFFGEVGDRARAANMAAPMDIDESDDSYRVTLDVPGVSLDSIEIEVHDDTLTIAGSREVTEASEGTDDDEGQTPKSGGFQPRRRERSLGSFERKVRMPDAIEADSITAELADGVLTIALPKANPEKGKRRIPVARA